jgi:hypothetical protein
MTLEQLKEREAAMLSKGPIAPEDAEEYAAIQDQIGKAELRGASTEDLQKQKDALYGKGGVMSPGDAALADAAQAEIARRENPDVGASRMTHDEFVEKYTAGTTGDVGLARMKAKLYAGAAESGYDIPDWFFTSFGESDAGYESRQGYREQMKEGRAGSQAPGMTLAERAGVGFLDGSVVGKTTRETAAERIEVKVTIDNQGQASITGTSGPSVTAGPGT